MLFAAPVAVSAATYVQADFTGAMNPGDANVKVPFKGNGFVQSQPFSGSFVYDSDLVPSGPVATNIFFSSFADIALIPDATAFSFNFGTLNFNLGDNLDAERAAGIQYKNGVFNGFVFLANFEFQGNQYQLRTEGFAITVRLLNPQGFPTGTNLINAHFDPSLTNLTPYDPNVGVAETPLPAALPLFAGGLGALALFARRRKQTAHAHA